MTARSMTGFARVKRSLGQVDAVMSVKSVNHRGLDLHFHMPPALDPFEPIARAAIKGRLQRGHVQVNVALEQNEQRPGALLNTKALERWLASFRQAAKLMGSSEEPSVGAALGSPGILETNHRLDWEPSVEEALTECLTEALAALDRFREREGAAIAKELESRAKLVQDLGARIEAIRSTAAAAFHARLDHRLRELLKGAAVDPQRLAQESAILTERSDISEEILRLKTHASQVLELLGSEGEKGKKLDFLLQEMNRETNTILSKTGGLGDHGLAITNFALEAKAEVDKMREQSLNLE